jgi:peptidoglycan/xylan/chitin deacetylase (PgdA/CDA1 family)
MLEIKNHIKQYGGKVFRKLFALYPGFENIKIILMYHRVLNEAPKGFYDPSLFVTSNTFEMHIKEIIKLFEIVSLEKIVQSNNEKGRLCAITFDDGWIDNYEIAFPILKRYRVPATIFIPVSKVGSTHCFWFERLTNLANRAIINGEERTFIQYFEKIVPAWKTKFLNVDRLLDLISSFKYLPADTLDDLVKNGYLELDIPFPTEKSIIGWDQVSEMGQLRITFGSHGLQHYILSTLDNSAKRKEIIESIKVLRENGVQMAPFFSYPNGNWDEESISLVSGAGYEGAFTTKLGLISSRTHPFLLNRVGLHENIGHTPELFWFRIFQAALSGSRPKRKIY